MNGLLRTCEANIIKMKRTPLIWVHVLVPVIGSGLFLSYYPFSQWDEITKVSGFLQTVAVAFPFMIAVVTSLYAELEKSAGDYKVLLGGSDPKLLTMLAGTLVLLFLGLLSALWTTCLFGVGFRLMGYEYYSQYFYVIAGIVLWLSSLTTYGIHMFVSFRFSKNISVGLGAAESLIAALFLTGLGDGVWPMAPCAWGGRFISWWQYVESPEYILSRYQGHIQEALRREYVLPCVMAIIITVVCLIGLMLWFNRWEGKSSEE
ncbi:MAG: lantibiotic immunity ABC transporter MutG family permease subunit [Firmicutes bacterium]|jgi:lantibiotic protection ABC transporter MutG family permease subunit|nr:lantibiotic immunity ABC transporter MutG family permease subunit [Bacillota bacterium]